MTVNDATRGTADDRRPGGTGARLARERLEQERHARTAELAVLESRGDLRSDEAALTRFDTLRKTLEEVEAALARLDAGTYGICEGCNEPIPEGRLEILPYARFCVRCQQRRR
ncbi:TraR/DksA family transcriptional regulator [Thermomonospora catenispora]|uniref:TraR/DksA family transcriptional regulator n=1 Tax=Thermomonospora catenispora TaxID=2493090 RepID=UPI001122CC41|nr:TraR/DksA C4-type zinc finger protein [Thermomonospora catenispora]TNY38599.1 molecular chaperone DnaK [Thermomonospora catenispora]